MAALDAPKGTNVTVTVQVFVLPRSAVAKPSCARRHGSSMHVTTIRPAPASSARTAFRAKTARAQARRAGQRCAPVSRNYRPSATWLAPSGWAPAMPSALADARAPDRDEPDRDRARAGERPRTGRAAVQERSPCAHSRSATIINRAPIADDARSWCAGFMKPARWAMCGPISPTKLKGPTSSDAAPVASPATKIIVVRAERTGTPSATGTALPSGMTVSYKVKKSTMPVLTSARTARPSTGLTLPVRRRRRAMKESAIGAVTDRKQRRQYGRCQRTGRRCPPATAWARAAGGWRSRRR